jgi:hypothetical protein
LIGTSRTQLVQIDRWRFVLDNGGAGVFKAPQNYRIFHGGYVSEFTEFIDHFLADHPDVVKSQKVGWHIYWDHVADLDELKKADQENSAATLSYYFPNSTQGIFKAKSHKPHY